MLGLGRTAKGLLPALGATFTQQTIGTLGRNLPLVIAPAVLADLGMEPALLGLFVALMSCAAIVSQAGCGGFIVRHGALLICQLSLLFLAAGQAAFAVGHVAALALAAVLIGIGGAISTPASSHLLGRFATPRQAPLVFSLKQTAVPIGLLMTGLVGPLMTGWWGWQGAALASAVACATFAVALEPLRREYDSDRKPGHPIGIAEVRHTLAIVMRKRGLRNLALACFVFSGMQTVFIAYFVTFLSALDWSLQSAGAAFSAATLLAVPGRIGWGWFAGVKEMPERVLGLLAGGMAASGIVLGIAGSWAATALILAGAIAMAGTALSWHGVLLAEAARLAPEGMRGAATGGVLSCGQVGGLVMPLAFALLLGVSGSYGLGFALCALPGFAVMVLMLRGEERSEDLERG
jgi:MFS family permease